MSKQRGINASLAVQAERLKTSMQSRDKRRSKEAQQRQVPAQVLQPGPGQPLQTKS